MALGKGQMRLDFPLALCQQRPHIPQSPGPTGQGAGTSVIEGFERVLVGQAHQTHDRAQAQGSLVLEHALGPLPARGAQFVGALELVVHLPRQRAVSAAQPQHLVKLARRQRRVQFELLPGRSCRSASACRTCGEGGAAASPYWIHCRTPLPDWA